MAASEELVVLSNKIDSVEPKSYHANNVVRLCVSRSYLADLRPQIARQAEHRTCYFMSV